MKIYLFLILSIAFLQIGVLGQNKKTTLKKTPSKKTVSGKPIERSFGVSTSMLEITDVIESDPGYNSLKNLIENYGVVLTYADNTFKGKEILKRGDFIVALNSVLNNIKNKMNEAGLDTVLINTYDRNRGGAYLTNVSQIKDLPESSIYYSAAKSLIEKWGIAAPFTIDKKLNSNTNILEKEVYDILHVTMGYNFAGVHSASAINRNKFAGILNEVVTQKIIEINSFRAIQIEKKEADRKHQLDSIQKIDMIRKDSIAKEIEIRKKEALKKEEEAKKKLAERKN